MTTQQETGMTEEQMGQVEQSFGVEQGGASGFGQDMAAETDQNLDLSGEEYDFQETAQEPLQETQDQADAKISQKEEETFAAQEDSSPYLEYLEVPQDKLEKGSIVDLPAAGIKCEVVKTTPVVILLRPVK